jgi:hypothetical protein
MDYHETLKLPFTSIFNQIPVKKTRPVDINENCLRFVFQLMIGNFITGFIFFYCVENDHLDIASVLGIISVFWILHLLFSAFVNFFRIKHKIAFLTIFSFTSMIQIAISVLMILHILYRKHIIIEHIELVFLTLNWIGWYTIIIWVISVISMGLLILEKCILESVPYDELNGLAENHT